MDRHPVAIALAMTPSFKSRLPITHEFIACSGSYSGLKTYIWNDLPEPYRIYYNQAFLERDIALYNHKYCLSREDFDLSQKAKKRDFEEMQNIKKLNP